MTPQRSERERGLKPTLRRHSVRERARIWLYLLHEEVVHAPVVVGASEDLQRVVLPLGRLQSRAADLHAAPTLHLGRRLLVLLQVSEGAIQRQIGAAGGRHVFLACCEEESSSQLLVCGTL